MTERKNMKNGFMLEYMSIVLLFICCCMFVIPACCIVVIDANSKRISKQTTTISVVDGQTNTVTVTEYEYK